MQGNLENGTQIVLQACPFFQKCPKKYTRIFLTVLYACILVHAIRHIILWIIGLIIEAHIFSVGLEIR